MFSDMASGNSLSIVQEIKMTLDKHCGAQV